MQIQITLEPFLIVDILSVSTSVMLGLLFMTTKTRNNRANIYLGLFLWSLSVEIFQVLIEAFEMYDDRFILQTSIFTIPFLLFYVLKTLNKVIKPVLFLLFTPFVLQFTPFDVTPIEYLINISVLIYIIRMVNQHIRSVGDYYSDIENKTLNWIKAIVYIFLMFHALWITEDIISIFDNKIPDYFAYISSLATLVTIYWIGYNGFSQPEIFSATINEYTRENGSDKSSDVNGELETVGSENEVKSDDINESDLKVEFENLNKIVVQKRLFMQKDITIRSLSKQLNVNERYFSKLIKDQTQKNFYHYINQFRVDEFKRVLASPKSQQLSLVGLAFEAGFTSKSTFYSAFKTIEGTTPKQYLDQLELSE